MTDSPGTPSPKPGWYADPAGLPRQRWWDGTQWTEHLHDPSLEAYGAIPKTMVGAGTPVYNVFIWTLAGLPIVSLVSYLLFDWTVYLASAASGTSPAVNPGYLFLQFVNLVVYGATVVLAIFDWRALKRDGFERPFHWAWAFLANGVYLIGRSVTARRPAGRGLAPIWVWAAITLVFAIVVAATLAGAISTVMSTMPS